MSAGERRRRMGAVSIAPSIFVTEEIMRQRLYYASHTRNCGLRLPRATINGTSIWVDHFRQGEGVAALLTA